MDFLNRNDEMGRLERLAKSREGGLAVLYGRRRIGKTRLLLEWSARHGGLYTVADQSTAEIQRRYLAEAVAERLPGFADVEYRDWRGFFNRLAREARAADWRGPMIFDELPYLVVASPELPSVLQRFLDHEAREAGLVTAIAGSSQRMMQGFVLAGDAPLYGRARELLEIGPIEPRYLRAAFGVEQAREAIELYCAWGGVPRYWELAADLRDGAREQLDELVLDPLGPLHREPDRVLIEEVPSALEARPVLDAIGAGAHRVSEIGGRLGRPATSMARPLDRLMGMGLVTREVPFGESGKKSRKSLYHIADPFFRLWFRVVAPHRGQLATASRAARLELLERYWKGLAGQAWEELCRLQLPRLVADSPLAARGPWSAGARWWKGTASEWDVVSESLDGERLLLGEAKYSRWPFARHDLERLARGLTAREPPALAKKYRNREPWRVLFVPATEDGGGWLEIEDVLVVTADGLLG